MLKPKHPERAPAPRQRRVYSTAALPRRLRAAMGAARPSASALHFDKEAIGGRAGGRNLNQ
jgi:hypothetical protein